MALTPGSDPIVNVPFHFVLSRSAGLSSDDLGRTTAGRPSAGTYSASAGSAAVKTTRFCPSRPTRTMPPGAVACCPARGTS